MGATWRGNILITADASDCLLFWRCSQELAAKGLPGPLLSTMPGEDLELQGAQMYLEAGTDSPHALHTELEVPVPKTIPSPGAAYKETQLSIRHAALPGTWTGPAHNGSTAARLNCNFVVGLTTAIQNGTLWLPPQGLVVHAVDNTILVNELHTERQRYLSFNQQRISCMASVDGASSVIATASECGAVHDFHKPVCCQLWL
jgi:hypothetical protein